MGKCGTRTTPFDEDDASNVVVVAPAPAPASTPASLRALVSVDTLAAARAAWRLRGLPRPRRLRRTPAPEADEAGVLAWAPALRPVFRFEDDEADTLVAVLREGSAAARLPPDRLDFLRVTVRVAETPRLWWWWWCESAVVDAETRCFLASRRVPSVLAALAVAVGTLLLDVDRAVERRFDRRVLADLDDNFVRPWWRGWGWDWGWGWGWGWCWGRNCCVAAPNGAVVATGGAATC